MTDHSADIAIWNPAQQRGTVRLRTFMTLRAVAIGGQVLAVVLVGLGWGIRVPAMPVALIIGVAAVLNAGALLLYPRSRRLSEGETAALTLFDIAQLSALLYFTGGLSNPFSLLIIGPIAIAATVLGLGAVIGLSAAAIGAVTLLALWNVPLLDAAGAPLVMPPLFVLGFWAAICLGVVFVAAHNHRVASEREAMSEALAATQAALERERKLTDLGGVVAATAHELGTPLATIRLVATEMAEELPDGEMRDDARLIGVQADRCRDLLRSMGRSGRDDAMMRQAPAGEVLREAAEPHAERGARLIFDTGPEGGEAREPIIRRSPEIVHGLRNLVQNAVDFAAAEVRLTLRWTPTHLTARIDDDGPGFPSDLLGRVGEPYLHRRGAQRRERRGGRRGMGLGLFIAKTLLERSGAALRFENAPGGGARVTAAWPLRALQPGAEPAGSGPDPQFLP